MDIKIVVAPDSFKGCLSAAEVADSIAEGVKMSVPEACVVKIPLADGGEGTVDAIASAAGGQRVCCEVSGPLGSRVEAEYLILGDGTTAVMECASAIGLPLLDPALRDPERTGSRGVGEMIENALDRGCRKIVMGLGGSSTNDGGMGMLTALGVRFYDDKGRMLPGSGADMQCVASIDVAGIDTRIHDTAIEVACDVDNPFYGINGAAHVFAPQKGADADAVLRLDAGLRNLAEIIRRDLGVDLSAKAGAGAAGGLGGAFMAFLGAEMRPGIDIVMDAAGFDQKISDADMVITGEGSIDRQSLMGKVLSGILKRTSVRGIPVVSLAGRVADCGALNAGGLLAALCIQQGPASLRDAMDPERTRTSLCSVASQLLNIMKPGLR